MNKFKPVILITVFIICTLAQAGAEEVLKWQDCIKEAAKNHPDLISAEEAVKQSEATKKIDASSLLPQVNSNLGISRAQTTAKKSDGSTKATKSDSYSYGLTGSQLLFDGMKTVNNVRQASENIKAAQYNYKFTSGAVRYRLRSAFINLLRAQELLNLTQEIRRIRRDNLELITLRYESGMEHRGALLTAEANLAEAEFEIIQAKRALEVAQRQLFKEMGRSKFSPVSVQGEFELKVTNREKPDFEAFAKNNPSLSKLAAQVNAASFGIKAAQANFIPELSVEAAASKTNDRWPPRNNQWNAGLAINYPLFEGGLRLAEIAQARAIYNQAQENQRSGYDSIILTLEETWASLQDNIDTVEVQKKFLNAAQERAKIAEAQYSLGLIQYDNWTIIEDDLVRQKKALVDAQTNTLLAEANWIQAKGETLEYAD
jgi:TolC family type I secretion outer membrane protein